MDTKNMFKADRNQAFAVVAMLAAVFMFATGDTLLGAVCFVAAAVFSLGGLFWNAHCADRDEQADADTRTLPAASESNKDRP